MTTRAHASSFLFLGAHLAHARFLPGKKFSVFSRIIGEKRLVISEGWMTEEQLLQQQQLLREKQEFDAWRASQAQANIQPQPQITSEGPLPTETNVDNSQGSASVARARPEDQITSKAKAKRQGLLQHLADPPLPRGTTLGGLAQPLGHLRPVPGKLSQR